MHFIFNEDMLVALYNFVITEPRITLDKTTVSINYNDEVVLICNVKAHPKPTIKWVIESDTPMLQVSNF